eukprot:COSAG06_NODE_62811_length_264_cov_0.618182_1_plen_52_part_01
MSFAHVSYVIMPSKRSLCVMYCSALDLIVSVTLATTMASREHTHLENTTRSW